MSVKRWWNDLINWSINGPEAARTALSVLIGVGFISLLAVMIAVPVFLDTHLGTLIYSYFWLRLAVGIPLTASGAALALWCVARFASVKGTPAPVNPPPVLVTSGPYAYSRNPMLTGIFVTLFGIGALTGSPLLFLVAAPMYVIVAQAYIKSYEEPELEARFGADYIEYKKRTPRLIPRIGLRRD